MMLPSGFQCASDKSAPPRTRLLRPSCAFRRGALRRRSVESPKRRPPVGAAKVGLLFNTEAQRPAILILVRRRPLPHLGGRPLRLRGLRTHRFRAWGPGCGACRRGCALADLRSRRCRPHPDSPSIGICVLRPWPSGTAHPPFAPSPAYRGAWGKASVFLPPGLSAAPVPSRILYTLFSIIHEYMKCH